MAMNRAGLTWNRVMTPDTSHEAESLTWPVEKRVYHRMVRAARLSEVHVGEAGEAPLEYQPVCKLTMGYSIPPAWTA